MSLNKFLFKCPSCEAIISIEINKTNIQPPTCPCGITAIWMGSKDYAYGGWHLRQKPESQEKQYWASFDYAEQDWEDS